MITIDQLIGPAGAIAGKLVSKCNRLRDSGGRLKVLLYGEPGVGKTEVANLMALALVGNAFAIESINGANVTIEAVRTWQKELCGCSLFSESSWRAIIINEVDSMSQAAQTLMLTLLDELPMNRAIICTSNMALGQLVERFQSRLQQFRVAAPSEGEIALIVQSKGVPADMACKIASGAQGNVRAALADAESYLDIAA